MPNSSVATIAGVVMARSRRRSITWYFAEASEPGATWLW